jgi:hypothetical protein
MLVQNVALLSRLTGGHALPPLPLAQPQVHQLSEALRGLDFIGALADTRSQGSLVPAPQLPPSPAGSCLDRDDSPSRFRDGHSHPLRRSGKMPRRLWEPLPPVQRRPEQQAMLIRATV